MLIDILFLATEGTKSKSIVESILVLFLYSVSIEVLNLEEMI